MKESPQSGGVVTADASAVPRIGAPAGVARIARKVGSLFVTLILVVVLTGSFAVSARLAHVAFGRHDVSAAVGQQLTWLEGQTSSDAPDRMQKKHRDGAFLQLVLTGMAAAHDESRPAAVRLPLLRAYLYRVEHEEIKQRYVAAALPENGAFYQGWTLLLATQVARLSGEEADAKVVREKASPLVNALTMSPSGLLASYPNVYRPVDSVVVAGALRRADEIVGVPGVTEALATWVPRLEPLRDPSTKLLPHVTDATGRSIEGPRATSQAIIQIFWPSIDPATSSRDWVAFENTFLCPRLGLVAVCEFPGGWWGVSDADSGPLIVGVSPLATVMTMAAARAHGNEELAVQISRETALFEVLSSEKGEKKHYNSDSWPLSDAVIVASRAVPVSRELPGVDDRDPVAWKAWVLCALIPGVIAAGALAWRVMGRRRRLSGPLEHDAAPPDAPSSKRWS
ncbi:hypothetical protein SAMN05421595_1708 [Austwickia chelonae]|nr:hypothetical protein [Austwickia chelonae]SEW27246.1 hypothetical protein SAMN05421595_1708 [Austwickia chelonae]